ncbi:HTH-type transcriptional activator TipA [Microbacterium ginsengisoli]|uniref:HTH-type transcriptional activator TipA n=1 Tax=Microbacterium ginsengisoli TaxID=400772 RepID=A0A0F0LYZ5_9MICO|nr:TipAS antibiotic-recognition domain-containing protein [Microbacterium ginsengisoli]KJL36616.1 HTH-type transcriptional activator TipA [Microbacterium ginsengisoli]MBN9207058.1 TipAS antibiotic-recognition domain-containing protein [Microbacterium ginsengisoli]
MRSITDVARIVGVTSRTLRHYDAIGLLPASSTTAAGYRLCDDAALVRLQRILLLRELGLPLSDIAAALDRDADTATALEVHLDAIERRQERLRRQAASVTHTIHALRRGERLMAENMFDGFAHEEHREEVERRWGADAYARSDAWWRGMSADDRAAWQERSRALQSDWRAAAIAGEDPSGDDAQRLADRHVAWLCAIPGTPAGDGGDVRAYVRGLGDMYVADPRFAANYGGVDGATFVRDALRMWADRADT